MTDTSESKETLQSALLLIGVVIAMIILGGLMYSVNKGRARPEAPGSQAPIPTVLPLAIVTIEIEVPDNSLAFRDDQYRLFFTYPKNWTQSEGEQIFVQGDLFNMAFTPAGNFAAGVPQVTDKDPQTYASEIHGLKSETTGKSVTYSTITIGKNKLEKAVSCGEDCLTYYYAYHNGNIYSFYTRTPITPNEAREKMIKDVFKSLILF